jgi:hypothetical protein
MDGLFMMLRFCKYIMDIEIHFDIWTFTLWDVFVFSIFASLIGWIIGKLLWINMD